MSGQFFEVAWTVRNLGEAIVATGAPPAGYASGQWADAVSIYQPTRCSMRARTAYLGDAAIDHRRLVEVADGGDTLQEYTVRASTESAAVSPGRCMCWW